MPRIRTTAALLAATAALAVAAAAPAVAGDVTTPTSTSAGSVVGDWTIRTDGIKQTITFTSDGKVSGFAGCNRFAGGYTTTAAGAITIGPLVTTLIACDEKANNAETSFLTRVQAAVSYVAKPKVLRLYTPKDLMVFRAG